MTPTDMTRRRFVTAVGIGGLTMAGSGVAAANKGEGKGPRERKQRNFRTHLAGRNEVPPVETDAQGQAKFQLNRAGDALSYKLIVANIENVVAAHIHCGDVGVNGPVGVTLFSGGPTSDSGVLAEGTVMAPDDGNGCGWDDLGDVLEAMRDGETYVNVHTTQNPPGEIRGQIH